MGSFVKLFSNKCEIVLNLLYWLSSVANFLLHAHSGNAQQRLLVGGNSKVGVALLLVKKRKNVWF